MQDNRILIRANGLCQECRKHPQIEAKDLCSTCRKKVMLIVNDYHENQE